MNHAIIIKRKALEFLGEYSSNFQYNAQNDKCEYYGDDVQLLSVIAFCGMELSGNRIINKDYPEGTIGYII